MVAHESLPHKVGMVLRWGSGRARPVGAIISDMVGEGMIVDGRVLILVIVAVFFVASVGYCLSPKVRYAAFYAISQKEFRTPGLDSDFVPQGLCRVAQVELYAVCGYMADGAASRLYLVETGPRGTVKMVTLKNEDGSDYRGHAGGVASWGDSLWIASDDFVYRLSLADVLAADGAAAFVDRFWVPVDAAFAFASDGFLWIGEFYEKSDYPTPESHAFAVAGGETNHAIVCAFKIDTSLIGGVASTTPVMALSVREKVQGIAKTKSGGFALSTSYGRMSDSWLYVYEDVTDRAPDSVFLASGAEIPLWYLDASRLKLKLRVPPMSENLETAGASVLLIFESASQKYNRTAWLPQEDVWSVRLP